MAVRRVPRRIGDLSERGGQLVDIVALKRVDDPAIGAGFGIFLLLARSSASPCMLNTFPAIKFWEIDLI